MVRVLVVEDDPGERSLFAGSLAACEYEVIEAATTAQAVATLRSSSVDVVVLDARFSSRSAGHHLTPALPAGARVPAAVVVMGHPDEATLLSGRRNGICVCLAKPFQVDRLSDAVACIVQLSAESSLPSPTQPTASRHPTADNAAGHRAPSHVGDGFHWRPLPAERAFVEHIANDLHTSINQALRLIVRRAMRPRADDGRDDRFASGPRSSQRPNVAGGGH
jgi:CheY-like chemotaxis protein